MKAILYRRCGPARDVLDLVDLPVPEPGPGEVLVQVEASGVNPHDVKKRSGWLGAPPPDCGVVPHSDGAGIIAACGPGVDTGRLGARVYFGGAGPTRGAAAEFCALPATHVFDLPAALNFDQGASLGVPAFTAWLAVLQGGGVTGDTVLINGGSGAVGRVAVEMASWNGATVIATAGTPDRCDIARAKGATHVLTYRDPDLANRILDLTDGRGVDRIVEVDLAANMATDAAVIAAHGTICAYSSTSDRTPVLPYYEFALKGIALRFIQASRMRPVVRATAARAIGALLDRGRIAPDVAQIVELADCAMAHEAVENGLAGANVTVKGGR
ncbi:MAG: NADPH:quinone reductase [Jannaschia sp.]